MAERLPSWAYGELKFHDIDVDDATPLIAGGTIQNGGSVCLIGQASTQSTRTGRSCTIKEIQWRWNLQRTLYGGTIASEPDVVRLILYLDKQANGATATITDILEANNYQAFRNVNNVDRFEFLYDETVPINPQAGAGNGTANDFSPVEVCGEYAESCHIKLEISGTANPAVIGNMRSNNLGVLVLTKLGARVNLDSKVRLWFTDA